MLDNVEEAIYETMWGSLKEGVIEYFEDARKTWERHGGPLAESFVKGIPGGPLRLKAGESSGRGFVLENDALRVDLWVAISWTDNPRATLKVRRQNEGLHRCSLDDLEDAADAIATHFFIRGSLLAPPSILPGPPLGFAAAYQTEAYQSLDVAGKALFIEAYQSYQEDLGGTGPDRDDWGREMEEELWEWALS